MVMQLFDNASGALCKAIKLICVRANGLHFHEYRWVQHIYHQKEKKKNYKIAFGMR